MLGSTSHESPVAFVDLRAQYEAIRDEVRATMDDLLASGQFILGNSVEEFERAFARYCQTDYAIGVDNGTNAITVALKALGISAGDEVITAVNSFVATAEAIVHAGAKPVLADIQSDYTIDVKDVEARLTFKTKAVIPVHLYGQIADMDPILRLAARHNLVVVEDAAQAHGAVYRGRKAGSMGQAGCFSFYPTKNLGAYGDAGAVICSDSKVESRIRALRDHGGALKYKHEVVGHNSRLDALQARILLLKLRYLDEWNSRRRQVAVLYNAILANVPGIVIPEVDAYREHVFHLYVIRVLDRRDALQEHLRRKCIATGIHYPQPIHLTDAFGFLGYRSGEFPVAEECAGQILSLPIYPEISRFQIEHVAEEVSNFMRNG
jgi:dTDP-4-amino-4,6-dideoxygalactose transaminase